MLFMGREEKLLFYQIGSTSMGAFLIYNLPRFFFNFLVEKKASQYLYNTWPSLVGNLCSFHPKYSKVQFLQEKQRKVISSPNETLWNEKAKQFVLIYSTHFFLHLSIKSNSHTIKFCQWCGYWIQSLNH